MESGRTWRALCVLLCLLASAPCHHATRKGRRQESNPARSHSCTVTKGDHLISFARGRTRLHLPCRFLLSEFHCATRTQVLVETSLARDGRVYVSGVKVNTSQEVKDAGGRAALQTDHASIDMDALGEFLRQDDLDTPHWTTSGRALFDLTSSGSTWRLLDAFDRDTGRTVLRDGTGNLRVSLAYVNGSRDVGKKGFLSVACTSRDFRPVPGAPGYLCGAGENRKHLKLAAAELKLSVPEFITYTVLVQQNIPQSNALCTEAAEVTGRCADPAASVRMCSPLLDARKYGRCLLHAGGHPLRAYVQCVRWVCRKDAMSCRDLLNSVQDCQGDGHLERKLKCTAARKKR